MKKIKTRRDFSKNEQTRFGHVFTNTKKFCKCVMCQNINILFVDLYKNKSM